MSWTTADLLTTIQNRQMFPDASTGSLSPSVFLQFATEELYITVLPMIMGVREKYYETYSDTTYTTSTTSIAIPARAIGGVVSVVQFLYGTCVRTLEPIDPSSVNTTQTGNSPSNFYFQNNSIIPYPSPSASYGTIRLRYFQRPNRLALVASCAQITAFNSGTGVATCTPVSTWTTANTFDFIPQTASQATPYNLGSAISAVSATTMTFTLTAAQAALVTVGDWIALAEYTPIPELPFEFQVVLAQATACKGLEAINDANGLAAANAKLDVYMQNATKLIAPRDQLGKKKVVSNWRAF